MSPKPFFWKNEEETIAPCNAFLKPKSFNEPQATQSTQTTTTKHHQLFFCSLNATIRRSCNIRVFRRFQNLSLRNSPLCVCVCFFNNHFIRLQNSKRAGKEKKEHQLQLSFKFGETKSCTTPQRHYVAV